MFARIRLTIDVIDERTVIVGKTDLLLVKELQIHDDAFTLKQAIEKSNKHGLGYLLPEDALEADVRKRIYKFTHPSVPTFV